MPNAFAAPGGVVSIKVEVFDDRVCALGEGPSYDAARNRAVWVDIVGRRVLWRDLANGETGECSTPGDVGAAVLRTDGRYQILLPDRVAVLDIDTCDIVDDFEWPAKHRDVGVPIRGNDAKADPAGRFYFGSMPYDHNANTAMAALYVREHGLTSVAIDSVTLSNGLGWSPDGHTMYFVDTKTFKVDAFTVTGGQLSDRRTFATPDGGGPDGLCVDAEGGVWLALWGRGRIQRYLPDGSAAEHIDVPGLHSSSCAFVGPDLDLLVITTATEELEPHQLAGAGLTYCARPGVRGLPTNQIAV
jgi:sugar lactone lactonase YvrE